MIVYIVVDRNYGYNDEYYFISGNGHPEKAFLTKESAVKYRDKRIVESLQFFYAPTTIETYHGPVLVDHKFPEVGDIANLPEHTDWTRKKGIEIEHRFDEDNKFFFFTREVANSMTFDDWLHFSHICGIRQYYIVEHEIEG